MSRSQDTVIDDDEETCPLCIEEFDLSDKNFRPCPCGYQICQFCFNSLKTTYEKSTCPNCRRPYDESTIQYKIPTAEEFKLDLLNKNKKQAAAKRKETEKREVETSARRNLAGVRVKQQNLVYVIGLEPTKKDESVLLETLRGKEFFGQYGDIEKIVVSKAKPGATNQGIGVYVTFRRKEDAATCIDAVDGSVNGERILRAQYGTTKYCSAFLRGETCMNKNCSFLHETGEDGHHTSIQNEPSEARHSPRPTLHSQSSTLSRAFAHTHISQPMARQSSKDTIDSHKGSHDGSALPPTAGWANINAPIARARRASHVASRGTPSPQLSTATPAIQKSEPAKVAEPAVLPSSSLPTIKAVPNSITPSTLSASSRPERPTPNKPQEAFDLIFQRIKACLSADNIAFNYDDSFLSAEERAKIADMPPLYDPYGGAKRRMMEEKENAEQARIELEAKEKLEAQAKSAAEDALEEDVMASGSLALGGEPEDNHRTAASRGTIQRPPQPSASGDQFTSMRSQTPQQARGTGFPASSQNAAFDMPDFDRRGSQFGQAQYDQISSHQRNGSRYFNTESKQGAGFAGTNRFQGGQQHTFYTSGVQGPPPGLSTAGTPPVSGGGMFAHGQGFTNTGFGSTKDSNTDALRGRTGNTAIHELNKRGGVEHLADPSILQARVHQGGTTGQGLFGGNQAFESFPPLPARPDPAAIEGHSRISSLQSFHTGRSSTPKVPPGFEKLHTPRADEEQTQIAKPIQPPTVTAPAVPVVSQRPSTPKLKVAAETSEVEGETKTEHVEGLADSLHRQDDTPRTLPVADAAEPVDPRSDPAPPISVAKVVDVKGTKVEKPTPSPIHTVANEEPATPPSKGASPARAASEVSRETTRRPRTIRLTTAMIKENESIVSASPDTEKSISLPAVAQAKQEHSRQPSVSSLSRSRPSTPSMSLSRDVSRANSPPPGGIVGSAPARTKSKAQTKKERKEKAKKVETAEVAVSAEPAVPVEPVAPVIARQKKQKKKASAAEPAKTKRMGKEDKSAADETDAVSSPQRSVTQASIDEPATPRDEDVAEASTTKAAHPSSYTMQELCNDAAQEGDDQPGAVRKILGEVFPSLSKLINEMVVSGDLSRDHPWLANPSFNSAPYKLPADSRKGQDYLDGNSYGANDAFGYVYLPQKEKRALYAGHAVSVADTGDRKSELLRRCLISPNGSVMRHLSAEESERVLELEERRSLYAEEFGELGQMNGLGVLEEDDFTNLGGGIEELGRNGSRHGVCWVMGEDGQDEDREAYDDDLDDDLLDEEGLSDETDEDLGLELNGSNNLTSTMPGAWDATFSTSASGDLGATGNSLPAMHGGTNSAVNLRAMDMDALQARIKEKQKEAELFKKEAEKAEKALARKTKELMRWKDSILKA